jgi:hypothetical protein
MSKVFLLLFTGLCILYTVLLVLDVQRGDSPWSHGLGVFITAALALSAYKQGRPRGARR